MIIPAWATSHNPSDITPPKSSATVTGTLNKANSWYYGSPPVISFDATDDRSGIRHIVVWYKGCDSGECILSPGDKLTLKKHGGNKGEIVAQYFAVDNVGNTEKAKKVSLYYDGTAPSLYVKRIYTESNPSIAVGSGCKDPRQLTNCMPIRAKRNETITLEVLSSDLLSGTASTSYRTGIGMKMDKNWNIVPAGTPQKIVLKFPKAVGYQLEIKSVDKAGNASEVKTFVIRISK